MRVHPPRCRGGPQDHRYYRPGIASAAVALRRGAIEPEVYPELVSLFAAPLVAEVTASCLGADGIYLTHDLPYPMPVTGLHYDRIHAVKFFVYLTDTDARSGAFSYVPGSHHDGRDQRLAHLAAGVPLCELPIIQPAAVGSEKIMLSGDAGTTIVYDTDGFHAGGVVLSGRERRVVRGHSHAKSRSAVSGGA